MDEKTFIFGSPVSGENFTDREKETRRLHANFTHGVNTILISPRRWGKTSLVKKAMHTLDDSKIKTVYIDIFACRSPEEFYTKFATEILKQTSSKQEEWMENIKSFLGRFNPIFSLSAGSQVELTVSLSLNPKTEDAEEILQIPEKIAQKKKCRIVLCIDEFQQIGEFRESIYFQKKLRSVWQHQQLTSYCLFGSKKHLMAELFSRINLPFYKFGDIIFLDKIPEKYWVPFIQKRFADSGKQISDALSERICRLVENQSNYVQQLAWITWINTQSEATEKDLDEAYQELLNHNSPLFESMTEGITAYQLNFLKAVASGVDGEFTRQEILKKFQLGTSANVSRIKASLLKEDLIDISERKVTIPDPVLREWINRL